MYNYFQQLFAKGNYLFILFGKFAKLKKSYYDINTLSGIHLTVLLLLNISL